MITRLYEVYQVVEGIPTPLPLPSPPPYDGPPAYYSATASLLIGGSIALSASALSSFAVNLQARALKQERIINSLVERGEEQTSQVLFDVHSIDHLLSPGTAETETTSAGFEHQQEEGSSSILDMIGLGLLEEDEEGGEFENLDPTTSSWPQLIYSALFPSRGNGNSIETSYSLLLGRKRLFWKAQWYIGFTLYLLCQLFGSVLALGFISPMILAPLGSFGLIFNLLFSSLFLGTGITRYDLGGTFLIFGGCAVVSLFGSKIPDPDKNVEEQIRLFTSPSFIAYATILVVLVILLFLLIKAVERNLDALKEVHFRERENSQVRRSLSLRSLGASAGGFTSEGGGRSSLRGRNASFGEKIGAPTVPPSSDSILPNSTTNIEEVTSATDLGPGASTRRSASAGNPRESLKSRRIRPSFVIETSSEILVSPMQISNTLSPLPFGEGAEASSISLQQHLQQFNQNQPVIPNSRDEAGEDAPLLLSIPPHPTSSSSFLIRPIKKGQLSSLIGVLYAVLGGIIASMTLLLTKSGVEMIVSVVLNSGKGGGEGRAVHHTVFSALIGLSLIGTAIGQVFFLNAALKYELPVIVLPLFYTFFTCLSLTNSMVYVNAFGEASGLDIFLLFVGVLLIIGGVFLLGRSEVPTSAQSSTGAAATAVASSSETAS